MRIYASLLFAATFLSAQTPPYRIPSDPVRDAWQKPDQVISALNFSATEVVAVIESGYPYFAPRIAPRVKQVYAVNTDPRAFQGRGTLPPGVSPIVGTVSDPQLSSLAVDTVIMIDVLQQQLITDRPPYYLGILAGLKPGGRLVIIDRILPSVYPSSERVTDLDLDDELPSAGFQFAQQFTFLQYQYFLIFKFFNPTSASSFNKIR
jgi:arsenite methyltransferase